jgi:hypothetical protein
MSDILNAPLQTIVDRESPASNQWWSFPENYGSTIQSVKKFSIPKKDYIIDGSYYRLCFDHEKSKFIEGNGPHVNHNNIVVKKALGALRVLQGPFLNIVDGNGNLRGQIQHTKPHPNSFRIHYSDFTEEYVDMALRKRRDSQPTVVQHKPVCQNNQCVR